MTWRWKLGPIAQSPCWWDEWLETGQKTGTSFTVRAAFVKHQNICLSPLSELCFLAVTIIKTGNICLYLHCILGKKQNKTTKKPHFFFLSNLFQWLHHSQEKHSDKAFTSENSVWELRVLWSSWTTCINTPSDCTPHKGSCHKVLCRQRQVSTPCFL